MRWDKAHLRTRVPKGGMDYKGFNTAMHELGHTVEQVFTLNDIDYYSLEGVPNTAFTEAFAFVFQERDLAVLGIDLPETEVNTNPLHELWQTAEIAGVSLLDMRIWRWLYAHPDSDAEALKAAVIDMAKEIWNAYFATLYGVKDSPILAIYSHILYCGMYIPDYAIGHIIANQINAFLEDKNLAVEMERMCKLGRLAPQIWMQQALGSPISPAPMIRKAAETIAKIKDVTIEN
jgi:oligoendopeptidase F